MFRKFTLHHLLSLVAYPLRSYIVVEMRKFPSQAVYQCFIL
jgi:hypothetical protein